MSDRQATPDIMAGLMREDNKTTKPESNKEIKNESNPTLQGDGNKTITQEKNNKIFAVSSLKEKTTFNLSTSTKFLNRQILAKQFMNLHQTLHEQKAMKNSYKGS